MSPRAYRGSVSASFVASRSTFRDDSLVVAELRMGESRALNSLAIRASGAEEEALLRRSWAVLLLVINLLLRRLAENTLLPGTIREEELDYDTHSQGASFKAENMPVASPVVLRALASTVGYVTLLQAMVRSLDLLRAPYWPPAQKRLVESFLLRGLDVIPRTAGIPANLITDEDNLVAIIKDCVTPRNYGSTAPPFFASGGRMRSAACSERVVCCRPGISSASRH